MPERSATAEWNGSLMEGKGKMALGSGLFEGPFSFATRMGDEPGTNPEELLGAALAGCYSMALNANLEKNGTSAKSVKTQAKVYLGKDEAGFTIRRIDLTTEVQVEGISDEDFQRTAEDVKKGCPVSRALGSVPINLTARLATT